MFILLDVIHYFVKYDRAFEKFVCNSHDLLMKYLFDNLNPALPENDTSRLPLNRLRRFFLSLDCISALGQPRRALCTTYKGHLLNEGQILNII